MTRWALYPFIAIAILLTGCSTLQVSADYNSSVDFAHMKTYAWETDVQPETGNIRLDDKLDDRRIRSAVEQSLDTKGYTRTDRASADFLVEYKQSIQQKIQSDNVQTGFGIGIGSIGRYGGIGISSGTEVQSYDEWLLLIDVLDPKNGDLLWRGKGTIRIEPHPDRKAKNDRISETVSGILAQFPPGSK